MYDRAHLRAAAHAAGDYTYPALAHRIGVSEPTGWRLWTGKTAPSARVAAAVHTTYGVPPAALIRPRAAQ